LRGAAPVVGRLCDRRNSRESAVSQLFEIKARLYDIFMLTPKAAG
jgi:hypothetical protein